MLAQLKQDQQLLLLHLRLILRLLHQLLEVPPMTIVCPKIADISKLMFIFADVGNSAAAKVLASGAVVLFAAVCIL